MQAVKSKIKFILIFSLVLKRDKRSNSALIHVQITSSSISCVYKHAGLL